MAQRLLRVGPQEIMTSIGPDLPGKVSPLWTRGENVIFDKGAVIPIPGEKLFIIPSQPGQIRGMASLRLAGVDSVFWGTLDKLFRWTQSGGVAQEGSGYTGVDLAVGGAPATMWSIVRWAEWVAATNGVNQAQIWKGPSTDFVNLSGPNFTYAHIFMTRVPHVVALNTSNGDNYAEWCAEGNIEDWTTGVGKTAGQMRIHELPGPIVAATLLGGEICFYTPTSQHILAYVGAPYWFGSRMLQDGFGCCGKEALVSVGRLHYGMDTQRCWVSDGSTWKSISDDEVSEFIYGEEYGGFNLNQRSKVVVEHMPLKGQIIFNWPSKNSDYNDRALPYSYRHNIWGGELTRERTSSDHEQGAIMKLSGNRQGYIFDWSERDIPQSPSTAGLLPVSATVQYRLGWKHGGWKSFWWDGQSEVLDG